MTGFHYVTTKEILEDSMSLPADISQVEWVIRSDFDKLLEFTEKLREECRILREANEKLKVGALRCEDCNALIVRY